MSPLKESIPSELRYAGTASCWHTQCDGIPDGATHIVTAPNGEKLFACWDHAALHMVCGHVVKPMPVEPEGLKEMRG